ncbi:hypothetical protein [Dyadobacter sp. CY326]|uniref:hypothetical protein n=1 Tax=Dyadobacter sp. CY326 TaxID=2907300 RepID=UPI001F380739|nr:hypothetical protein [Dyadobacter sp. CY326]MCE7066649.1 hypothetical protein [Dyadobacter sp. CY326]
MKSLSDTTALLEETISQLMGEQEPITPQAGVELIDQWTGPLSEAENTLPIAEALQQLKGLLAANPLNTDAVIGQMGEVAAKVAMLAPDMGTEGEMPSLLNALSTALRMSPVDLE